MDIISSLREKLFVPQLKTNIFSLHHSIKIPELPSSLDNSPATYEIIGGLVSAKLLSGLYSINEPILNAHEKELLNTIRKGLLEIINIDSNTNVEDYIEKSTRVIISELDLRLSEDSMRKILYYIYTEFVGLGKIETLLRDQLVTSISFNTSASIHHKLFGDLSTDIMLNKEELLQILRKLALHCNEALSAMKTTLTCTDKNFSIEINYKPEALEKSTFKITKINKEYPSPLDLVREGKVSPEILAYLWMLIEDKQNIYIVQDTTLLNALSYFLPPHSKILSNIPNYSINPFTESHLGNIFGDEDYALITDNNNFTSNGTLLTSTETMPEEEDKIICIVENGTVKEIKEKGKILFQNRDQRFYHDLSQSSYMNSQGNKAILDDKFNSRSKLLLTFIRNNLSPSEFKKMIQLYYNNPVAVLRRAGLV